MKYLIPAILLVATAAIARPAVPMQALDEARLLPVVTHNLHPGQQPHLALNLPGMTPLLLIGDDPAKAIHHPQSSLPQQIITALRDLLAHEFRLNNPNGGSDGWLTEEALWLVSKNAADAVRGWLLGQGINAVPQHNVRLFDEMQAHQLLIPCEDKAI